MWIVLNGLFFQSKMFLIYVRYCNFLTLQNLQIKFGICCQVFWAISNSVINILTYNCLLWACLEMPTDNSVDNYLFQQTNWDWLDPTSREWVLLINRLLYMNLSTHNTMLRFHWLIYVLIWQPWCTEIFCFGLLIKYFPGISYFKGSLHVDWLFMQLLRPQARLSN